jgi:hypothetical protein
MDKKRYDTALIPEALLKHYLGTVKVNFAEHLSVTAHSRQRFLSVSHVRSLAKSFAQGIDRETALPLMALADRGLVQQKATFDGPIIKEIPSDLSLVIISGQHRAAALKEIARKPKSAKDSWWIVDVYDKGEYRKS